MNTRRTVLAFSLALLISGLFTWVIGRATKNRTTAIAPRQVSHIVVASKDILVGEVLAAGSLSVSDWAAPSALAGAFTEPRNAIGRVALVSLVSGEPVLQRELAEMGSGQGISATIPRGMRAITIKGPEVTGVASFIEPGDLVDVLATCQTSGSEGVTSSTVLQAVRVFAVGADTAPTRGREGAAATSLTLLVAPGDVSKINLAITSGRMILAMRNALDTTQTAPWTEGATNKPRVLRMLDPEIVNKRGRSMNVQPHGSFTVETVSGGKLISQTFEGERP